MPCIHNYNYLLVSGGVSPVSIDRRIVSPTTRPTPASRMHGWPAVTDLTSGRPIRIALFQVGAAPTAPAHCKLSQHISQQSDSFLCSLKPRGAPIAWLVFRTGTWSETPAWFRAKLSTEPDASITLSFSDVSDVPVHLPTTQATSLIPHSFSGWRQKLSKRLV